MTSNQFMFLTLFIITTVGSIAAGCILPPALAASVIVVLCFVATIYILFG